MKPSHVGLLIFLLCCAFGSEPQKLRCHKTFTPDQLQEDFNILVTTLQEAHPDLYRVNSKKHIDSCIAHIRNQLTTSKTYLEFLKLIAPLFTEIGDINTQWGHSPEYIAYRNANIAVFPTHFRVGQNPFVVTDSGITKGVSIIEIDGEPLSDYLEKNYSLLPIDGKIRSVQWRWLESYFPQHHSNFWSQQEVFHLTVATAASDLSFITVEAQKMRPYTVISNNVPVFSKTGGIAMMNIPRFVGTDQGSYNEFLEQSFKQIREQKIDTLIIDLWGQANDGFAGMPFGMKLYSYLIDQPSIYVSQLKQDAKKVFTHEKFFSAHGAVAGNAVIGTVQPSPLAFQGVVYILANGWTSNARGYFCAMMDQRANTFFTGEECGACTFGMNSCALALTLPNSDLRFTIPTAQYVTNGKNYSSLHGPEVTYPLSGNQSEAMQELIGLIRAKK